MKIIIVTAITILFFIYLKKRKPKLNLSEATDSGLSESQVLKLSLIRDSDLPSVIATALSNHFKNLEPISLGGMGLIFKAYDIKRKTDVAIKTVLPELNQDEKASRLFFAECEAVKKMNHPNIVRVHEVGENEGIFFYSMEYLSGENLKSWMKKNGRVPLDMAIKIATQISRALQHCHDNQVIHRDIKPSNIFLTTKHNAKIIDFGIVKLLHDENDTNSSTKVGSPDFSSPEQIQGQKVSGKSDIYSLGVCLFYIITGKMPFSCTGLVDKMFTEPKKLTEYMPEAPEMLTDAIDSALKIDPSLRPNGTELWATFKKIDLSSS